MTDKPMDDLVERVAQRIYEKFDYVGPGEKPAWVPRGNSLKQDEARRYARVAIHETLAGIREPSDHAVDGAITAEDTRTNGNVLLSWATVEHTWRAMIDAMLQELGDD